MRLQIFDRMLLFNFVVSCGLYRLKLFFLLDRILIRKLISLLLFLKMAVEFSTLKGISIIPIRLGEHPRKRSRENVGSTMGRRRKTHRLQDRPPHWTHGVTVVQEPTQGCSGLDAPTFSHGIERSARGLTPPAAPGRWWLWGNRNLWFKYRCVHWVTHAPQESSTYMNKGIALVKLNESHQNKVTQKP